jgi:hypothetical protein
VPVRSLCCISFTTLSVACKYPVPPATGQSPDRQEVISAPFMHSLQLFEIFLIVICSYNLETSHKDKDIHPENDNCSVCQNVGKPSIFYVAYSCKPKW